MSPQDADAAKKKASNGSKVKKGLGPVAAAIGGALGTAAIAFAIQQFWPDDKKPPPDKNADVGLQIEGVPGWQKSP